MNHKEIEDLDLVDRYLMGTLSHDESTQFEEHFVDCLPCVDRLRTTKALIEGFRLVARDAISESPSLERKGMFWHLRQMISRPSFALVTSVLLLLAILGLVVMSNRVRHSQVEVDQAKSATAHWEGRYNDERESSFVAEKTRQEREQELTAEITKLQAELEDERKQLPSNIADQYDRSKRPQINLAIFVLKAARAGNPSSGPINQLTIPRRPASFVISVPLEGEVGYREYRMTISSDLNRTIWKDRGLKPDQYKSLSVQFNSTLFRDGDYLLSLEGISADGRTNVIGKYAFRVSKAP